MENNHLGIAQIAFVSDEQLSQDLIQDIEMFGYKKLISPPLSQHFIQFQNGKLSLHTKSGLQLKIDFTEKKYHRSFNPSKDLLCRACGWHLGYRQIWDLTAGLAVDSILLVQAGFQVLALERNQNLVLLLRHALRDYQSSTQFSVTASMNQTLQPMSFSPTLVTTSNLTLPKSEMLAPNSKTKDDINSLTTIKFVWSEAESFLTQFRENEPLPEVIYYDPMYPAKNKTALPSKEMQILRELIGVNEEEPEIIQKALSLNVKRVVVKRPLKANVILEKPKFQLSSKLVRYDIY